MQLARMSAGGAMTTGEGGPKADPSGALKSFTSFVLVRLGVGALLSAGIILGGVQFIVSNAIGTTNLRITDLNVSITDRIRQLETTLSDRLAIATTELRGEFKSTRDLLGRALKDGPYGMASWRAGGAEFFYPRQGVGISLYDFLQKTSFSMAASELEKVRGGNILEQIRFIAAPPNDLFSEFRARGFRIEDAFISIDANLDKVKSIAAAHANCITLNSIGPNKWYIDVVKNNAIVLDDAIVCPTLRLVR